MPFAKARAAALVAPHHLADAVQEAYIGLWNAVNTFDSGMGIKFHTYVSVCIKNKVLSFVAKDQHQTKDFVFGNEGYDSQEGKETSAAVSMMNLETVKEIIEACGKMTKREEDILHNRMLAQDPDSHRKIAERWETSHASIIRDENKLKDRIRKGVVR